MKKFIFSLLLMCSINQIYGQTPDATNQVELNVGTDIVSRYVWRGSAFSTRPSIQPNISLSHKGIELGYWGSYSFQGNDGAELDFYLSYTFLNDLLTLTFTDYFFPNDILGESNYFEFEKDNTGHIMEASVLFNGNESIPFTLLVATNFFGGDTNRINDDPSSNDFNSSEGIAYSTYLELGYSFAIKDKMLNAFVGFTPNEAKEARDITYNNIVYNYSGESGYYGKDRGVVNIGLTAEYALPITKEFALPLSSSLIVNPMTQNIFLVVGLSL